MTHRPFRELKKTKHELAVDQVVLADDKKLTSENSNNMMFNLLRVMVFFPVTIRDFIARCVTPLRDTQAVLDKDDVGNCVLTYELVEGDFARQKHRGQQQSCRDAPIVSRFANMDLLLAFIKDNRVLDMPTKLYGVRVCLAHYVADCFVYAVRSQLRGLNRANSGRVEIVPLTMFGCGKNQAQLGGQANISRTQTIQTHIPSRVRSGGPSILWRADGDADLYWLPSMQKVKPEEIKGLMDEAYSFHVASDLAFDEPDTSKAS